MWFSSLSKIIAAMKSLPHVAALIICVLELNALLLWSLFLFVKWFSTPHLLILDTKLPKVYWFRKQVQRPSSLDIRDTWVVSIVRSHPLNAPVIGSGTLRLWKCNKQSCPHNHLMVIVLIYGLSMQRSCPEGVEAGSIIAKGLCR